MNVRENIQLHAAQVTDRNNSYTSTHRDPPASPALLIHDFVAISKSLTILLNHENVNHHLPAIHETDGSEMSSKHPVTSDELLVVI